MKTKPWPVKRLDQILSPEQLLELAAILKANPDGENAFLAMVEYFHSIEKDLEAKEIIPSFLAYIIYLKLPNLQNINEN